MSADAEDDLRRPGDIVAGRYRIEGTLGEGGMGAVFRATQLGLERSVALKLILPEKAASERARRRFVREARITASIKHPGVVQIFDFGEDGDTVFIAMELLSGRTLRDFVDLDLPRLGIERATAHAAAIADTLAAVAESELVHRDLKPENVVFDGTGSDERVVLVDFGLAFAIDGDETTGRVTREGVLSGTPDYMAPEQCTAAEVGPPADVYALGCMLYEMLSSKTPFAGDPAIVLSRHLFVPPKPLRERAPEEAIPGALDELVMDMLRKEPSERPTAAQVRDRLLRLSDAGPERKSGKVQDGQALGRAARMVSAPSIAPGPGPLVAGTGTILWVGSLKPEVEEALLVAGVHIARGDVRSPLEGVDAVVLAEPEGESVRRFSSERPVVALAPSMAIEDLTELVRGGAQEALPPGASAEDIVRKIGRVLRRRTRAKGQ
ncbi:MAG: serine/threonine-protein kinase [Myxococcota bacterium]